MKLYAIEVLYEITVHIFFIENRDGYFFVLPPALPLQLIGDEKGAAHRDILCFGALHLKETVQKATNILVRCTLDSPLPLSILEEISMRKVIFYDIINFYSHS